MKLNSFCICAQQLSAQCLILLPHHPILKFLAGISDLLINVKCIKSPSARPHLTYSAIWFWSNTLTIFAIFLYHCSSLQANKSSKLITQICCKCILNFQLNQPLNPSWCSQASWMITINFYRESRALMCCSQVQSMEVYGVDINEFVQTDSSVQKKVILLSSINTSYWFLWSITEVSEWKWTIWCICRKLFLDDCTFVLNWSCPETFRVVTQTSSHPVCLYNSTLSVCSPVFSNIQALFIRLNPADRLSKHENHQNKLNMNQDLLSVQSYSCKKYQQRRTQTNQ